MGSNPIALIEDCNKVVTIYLKAGLNQIMFLQNYPRSNKVHQVPLQTLSVNRNWSKEEHDSFTKIYKLRSKRLRSRRIKARLLSFFFWKPVKLIAKLFLFFFWKPVKLIAKLFLFFSWRLVKLIAKLVKTAFSKLKDLLPEWLLEALSTDNLKSQLKELGLWGYIRESCHRFKNGKIYEYLKEKLKHLAPIGTKIEKKINC